MGSYRQIDFENIRDNTGNLCLGENLLLCECSSPEEMNVPAILSGISIIGICLKGYVLVEIGSRSHNVHCGMALMLFPGESFRLSGASTDLNIKFIVFKEDFIRWKGEILNTVGFSNETDKMHLLPLSDESMQECIATYETIRRRLESRVQRLQHEVIMHYLQILIYDLYDSSVVHRATVIHAEQDNTRNIFEQFLFLVSNQYREHSDVAYYADRLCISPKHLSRIVFSTSGKHASEWIANARIIESKICLRMTKLSLSDISDRLNFSSPSHFGRFFKRHTGLTPKEYKNQ